MLCVRVMILPELSTDEDVLGRTALAFDVEFTTLPIVEDERT